MNLIDPFKYAPPAIPTDGLIGWWKFDELSGTIAHDSSSTGNDMTLQGTTSNYWWSAGKKDGALNLREDNNSKCFSGNPDAIKVNDLTASIWINIPVAVSIDSSYRGIFVKQSAWGIFTIDGLLGYYDWGGAKRVVSSSALIAQTWQNITLTRRGSDGKAKMYLNGNLILDDYITISSHISGLAVGAGSPDGIQKLNGYYDQALLYNRVLTDAEISIISK